MQFKHPEILYALLLLLIPIFVHLFQLRRFQKVDFTNVAFLKKATLQTRKSSRLKKWLTLLTRLMALACIILAFAQPFSASKKALNTEKETVVYLDNSFSMELKGSNGSMLNKAMQDLYENLSGDEKISWFTNTETKKDVSQTDFKNEVLAIDYSHNQLNLQDVLLKAQQLFTKSNTADKQLILISDFQQKGSFPKIDSTCTINLVQTRPVTESNIAIDTAYVIAKDATGIQLQVTASKMGNLPENTAISLFNGNNLVAKTALDFSNSSKSDIVFDIENTTNFKGEIQINDGQLSYDNSLFFSINAKEKINVLSINQANSDFLRKLFDNENYNYIQQEFDQLNYSNIPNQNFIIINELETIPASLTTAITEFCNQGGSVLIIPAKEIESTSYNNLLNGLNAGIFDEQPLVVEKKIAKINFSHPLYNNVFEKRVTNFQFPSVQSYFQLASSASKVLSYEDDKPFIIQTGNTFIATAAFNQENSNFKTSPLIVPTLINMAQQSLALPKLYFEVGKQNNFSVPIALSQDEILTIKDSISSFIPLQQTKAKSVAITTENEPITAGNYGIFQNENELQGISYNYARTEGVLAYANIEDWEGARVYSSVSDLFNAIAEENDTTNFWKWFVIFAVLFLLVEMFILKFFK